MLPHLVITLHVMTHPLSIASFVHIHPLFSDKFDLAEVLCFSPIASGAGIRPRQFQESNCFGPRTLKHAQGPLALLATLRSARLWRAMNDKMDNGVSKRVIFGFRRSCREIRHNFLYRVEAWLFRAMRQCGRTYAILFSNLPFVCCL